MKYTYITLLTIVLLACNNKPKFPYPNDTLVGDWIIEKSVSKLKNGNTNENNLEDCLKNNIYSYKPNGNFIINDNGSTKCSNNVAGNWNKTKSNKYIFTSATTVDSSSVFIFTHNNRKLIKVTDYINTPELKNTNSTIAQQLVFYKRID